MNIQEWLYKEIDATARNSGISLFNIFICIIIIVAVMIAIVETEQPIARLYPSFFRITEITLFTVFVIEFCLRVYVAPLNPKFSGRFGRIRYLFSLWAIIDLIAILPFVLTFMDASAFYLRLARILRILRVSRLGRFSKAWSLLAKAVYRRRFELIISGIAAFLLLIFSSAFLYVFESDAQPEAFGSIPRALWWGVVTLTTVGYGDITPVTAGGRIFAGLTAVAGVGLVAMPAGILAAAFSDAFQRQEREQ